MVILIVEDRLQCVLGIISYVMKNLETHMLLVGIVQDGSHFFAPLPQMKLFHLILVYFPFVLLIKCTSLKDRDLC